jgi:ribosome maturation factor RimP
MRRDQTHLWELFEPVVSGLGFDLIEIEHFPNPKHGVLRLYIDTPEGTVDEDGKPKGVVVNDCSAVSRQISALIDVEDPVRGQFNLEVSSPGLDRPLRRLQDFQRFIGALVKIKTVMPMEGQRNFKGRLLAATEEVLVLETDTEELSVPMNAVEKARIVPEF